MLVTERHIVEGLPTTLKIEAIDQPSMAGANHHYIITGFDTESNPSRPVGYTNNILRILFQNGVVPEVGHNGITLESLLAVCEHRLQGFQNGQFACDENQEALEHITKAIDALKGRTAARLARDVEGKHIK